MLVCTIISVFNVCTHSPIPCNAFCVFTTSWISSGTGQMKFSQNVTGGSYVYYKAPLGLGLLRRKLQSRSRSKGPRRPGLLCRIEPSWQPGLTTEPCPKGPPETVLQPKPGLSQNLHPGNPKGELTGWIIQKLKHLYYLYLADLLL